MRGSRRRKRTERAAPRIHRTSNLALATAALVIVTLISYVFISRHIEIVHRTKLLAEIGIAQEAAAAEQVKLRDRLATADDPDAIELHARRRLGLVFPGEVKVVFVEEDP